MSQLSQQERFKKVPDKNKEGKFLGAVTMSLGDRAFSFNDKTDKLHEAPMRTVEGKFVPSSNHENFLFSVKTFGTKLASEAFNIPEEIIDFILKEVDNISLHHHRRHPQNLPVASCKLFLRGLREEMLFRRRSSRTYTSGQS